MSEAEKEAAFNSEASYQARLDGIAQERVDIYARNRARLPIKEQHLKQSNYVKTLVDDIESVKSEQNVLLLKWQELELKIETKTTYLKVKQAELAELATKVAAEDAITPAINRPAEESTDAKLDAKEAEQFELLRAFMAKSNIKELLKSEGADDVQVEDMEKMWQKCGSLLSVKATTPSPPIAQAQVAADSSRGQGLPETVGVPGSDKDDMDLDGFEAEWNNHLDSNPDIAKCQGKELEHKKATFIKFQQAAKRARTA